MLLCTIVLHDVLPVPGGGDIPAFQVCRGLLLGGDVSLGLRDCIRSKWVFLRAHETFNSRHLFAMKNLYAARWRFCEPAMRINDAALLFFHKEQANKAGGIRGSYWPPSSIT